MNDGLFRHLTRKKYIEAMNETQYGWARSENFPHVGCPSDLEFISVYDQPFGKECHTSCKQCWEFVLKNKKW